ncbi:sphinganine hydroxylase-like protein Sur2 [Polyplosphaeria fusca]|uniref:Sphinganine hydroxylase-like protein Sur2 n=1 Tax=Polyplosphaeria fusca TaxID=682080 RepID=A0A9P4R420_9PLEO|nr:sphinganine hydroxylase-like protein Sur2 [Polyplosphaeria fusca]
MAVNASFELPPLPAYTLRPQPPLLSWISDGCLALAVPIVGYWMLSGIFHFIDTYDLFPQYRLHTPAEVLKRNHVTRWQCFRDVVIQQIIQTAFGLAVLMFDEETTIGKEAYDVAWYARCIRIAQRAIPVVLATVGLDPTMLAVKYASSHPMLAGVIAGGKYPDLVHIATIGGQEALLPTYAPWELLTARAVYHFIIPAVQFFLGFAIIDTWEYFLHRAMHMNKWLYVTFHSRHHRLYVPYAYGALYNHPIEGFVLDTLGSGLAYLLTGMTARQSMFLFGISSCKTVDDHSGYALPFDPLHWVSSNNATYHDIHHQSWGIKSNFAQPFFTFWDSYLGTTWKGDTTLRYEKGRRVAQQKLEQDSALEKSSQHTEVQAPSADENAKSIASRRNTRKKSPSFSQSASNWKGLRKVNESLHGKGGNVLGLESNH